MPLPIADGPAVVRVDDRVHQHAAAGAAGTQRRQHQQYKSLEHGFPPAVLCRRQRVGLEKRSFRKSIGRNTGKIEIIDPVAAI
jgi:hypothetical protein